jgi:hypothetical protein
MAYQKKLYSRLEMTKTMNRNRFDYENEKAGKLLQSKEFQCKALAKKGHSVALIAKLLKISHNQTTRYLIEK